MSRPPAAATAYLPPHVLSSSQSCPNIFPLATAYLSPRNPKESISHDVKRTYHDVECTYHDVKRTSHVVGYRFSPPAKTTAAREKQKSMKPFPLLPAARRNLHPKPWYVHPKLWYVHPKPRNVRTKLWDVDSFSMKRQSFPPAQPILTASRRINIALRDETLAKNTDEKV